jgi:hypothetical protein
MVYTTLTKGPRFQGVGLFVWGGIGVDIKINEKLSVLKRG